MSKKNKKNTTTKLHIPTGPKSPNFGSPNRNLLNDTVIPDITLVVNILIVLNVVLLHAAFVAQLVSTIYLINISRDKFFQLCGSLLQILTKCLHFLL